MEKNKITFFRAISLFWKRSSDIESGSSRREFWFGAIFVAGYLILGSIFLSLVWGFTKSIYGVIVAKTVVSLIIFIPWLSLSVRRFKDAGFSFLKFFIISNICGIAPAMLCLAHVQIGLFFIIASAIVSVIYWAIVCSLPSKPLQKRD